ncbi:MAG: hypothetical protein AB7S75_02570 [Desulfococcaceae bacterium]
MEYVENYIKESFRYVKETGEQIIITDQNNIPVLKMSRLHPMQSVNQVFKDIRGKMKYHADILEPETEEWDG